MNLTAKPSKRASDPDGVRLAIPILFSFEEFDPRSISDTEITRIQSLGESERELPFERVEWSPNSAESSPIPLPISLRDEQARGHNTLVLNLTIRETSISDALDADILVRIVFSQVLEISITLHATSSPGSASVDVELDSGARLGWGPLASLLLLFTPLLIVRTYGAVDSNAVYPSDFERWIEPADIQFYLGMLLGFVGLQLSLVRQLIANLGSIRSFWRFPQLYLDPSLLWALRSNRFRVAAVLANLALLWISVVQSPVERPTIEGEGIDLVLVDPREGVVVDEQQLHPSELPYLRVQCADCVACDDEKQLGTIRALSFIEVLQNDHVAHFDPGAFEVVIDRGLAGNEERRIEVDGSMLLRGEIPGVDREIAADLKHWACGPKVAASALKFEVQRQGQDLVVSTHKEVPMPRWLLAVRKLQDEMGRHPRGTTVDASAENLEKVIGETEVIGLESYRRAIGDICAPLLESADGWNRLAGVMLVHVVFRVYQHHPGQDLRSSDIQELNDRFEASFPRGSLRERITRLRGAVVDLILEIESAYPHEAAKELIASMHEALDNSGGEAYLDYLAKACKLGLLEGNSAGPQARRTWLGDRFKAMRELKAFDDALAQARRDCSEDEVAAGFLQNAAAKTIASVTR